MGAPIADPLIHEAVPSRSRHVGKATAPLSFIIGLGCAVLWNSSWGKQYSDGLGPLNLMATRPMQMQAARVRNFMQPARALKSPAGMLDIVVPITTGKSKVELGELDIMVPITKGDMMAPEAKVERILQSPVTKREVMAATAAVAAAATHGIAQAEGEEDEEYKTDTLKLANLAKDTVNKKASPEEVKKLKDTINSWVATYRRQPKFAARPSYSNMYAASNAIAGHYNSFGPGTAIPKKRLERVNTELDTSIKLADRGK